MAIDFDARQREIYMDNAATTVIDDEVVAAMQPFLEERYGNPETPYHLGREAKDGIEKARSQVAELVGCKPEEIYFTSGGTESNNWAIKGLEMPTDKNLIVVSSIEHKSVLEPVAWMGRRSLASVRIVPVDALGLIRLDSIESYLKEGSAGLVSIQYANNEVGTLQPIDDIGEICKKYGVIFHTDAVQAFGKININASAVDMASLSAHKIHGPMGVGALYVKGGTNLEPLLHGGGHESGMRSGTHGVPQIIGFGKAAELAWSKMRTEMTRISNMVEFLAGEMRVKLGAVRNGDPKNRLPNILNMTLPNIDASLVSGILNRYGICVATGAACATREGTSHVLRAMGRSITDCSATLRISLSRFNNEKESSLLVSYLQVALADAKKRTLV